jgi:hypothetical protein
VAELIAEMDRLRWLIEMFCKTFKQLLGCRHLFSDNHNGVEIQASCGMIVCMLILIDTGEKPNRAMYQMVWSSLIGLASLNELEAFITRRRSSATAQPRPQRRVGFHAARIRFPIDVSGGVTRPTLDSSGSWRDRGEIPRHPRPHIPCRTGLPWRAFPQPARAFSCASPRRDQKRSHSNRAAPRPSAPMPRCTREEGSP